MLTLSYPHIEKSDDYFDHQEEIDREIRQEWQQVQENMTQAAKSPFYIRMKAKGLL